MKWSIRQIEELGGLPLSFSEKVDVKSSLMERESELIDVSPVTLDGQLLYTDHSILAQFAIQVVVTLPSSRTLRPVPVELALEVEERYVEVGYLSQYLEASKMEVILPLEGSHIDLKDSIIDSILLNLPIQVLSDEEQESSDLPSGNGWVLYTEDAYNKQKQREAEERIDPRLAGLKNLQLDQD